MHYLIHYPSLIQKYGPLFRLWAMRFEAKHQYFKVISHKIHNFKNISHSLAMRHQYLQCFSFTYDENADISISAGCCQVLYEHLSDAAKEYVIQNNLSSTCIFSVKAVRMDGRTYRAGCVIVNGVRDHSHRQFLQLTEILFVNRVLVIVGRILETISFDDHFHVYVVDATEEHMILSSLQESTAEPVYLREHKGRTVINARCGIY